MINHNNNIFLNSTQKKFHYENWLSEKNTDTLILAIHGYNAHAGSFEIPANFFKKFGIETIAFDLRGFGKNSNFGEWYPLKVHVNDVEEVIKKIVKKKPKQKFFLLGESMGAAVVISLINKKKNLPIDGLILVSPAIWNFTQTNPLKSFIMKSLSKFFPNHRFSGKGLIKVRPSNNIEMLKNYAADPLVIHKPKARSLYGIIQLMDKAYEESKIFFKNPIHPTLVIIPTIDEIVPRKPILNLFKNISLNENLFLAVYDNNFHMILRDLDGDKVSEDIKEWIIDDKKKSNFQIFRNSLKKLEESKFYHKLD